MRLCTKFPWQNETSGNKVVCTSQVSINGVEVEMAKSFSHLDVNITNNVSLQPSKHTDASTF